MKRKPALLRKEHSTRRRVRTDKLKRNQQPGWECGAVTLPEGGVRFKVWGPNSRTCSLEVFAASRASAAPSEVVLMKPDGNGYFSLEYTPGKAGMLYKYKLENGSFPDPASRFQPEGPHGPSQVVDLSGFNWSDRSWRGVPRSGQVVYEMHIGTFTPEGTWRAAIVELPELKRLGVTVLEVMPVAEFPGRFGWGYDGVSLFAPSHLYGGPEDFCAFIDAAHDVGVGVILDVVYNHLGPDGNYLKEFSKDYFTDRYKNEWGQPINFDGPNCAPVREFFLANAEHWIREYHLDGLRLDATQQIFDNSGAHILCDMAGRARRAAGERKVYLIGENEPQDTNLLRPPEQGGFGLDALWNDDFHHSAIVAVTGQNEAYYSDHLGAPQEFISAAKYGFLYQGQWYSWQQKGRGSCTRGIDPEQFILFIQNHDQIANSLRGLRIHHLTSPGHFRALTALFLLFPGTPMLFQGQEFAASTPFRYFADHRPDLARAVAAGRKKFLSQFPSVASAVSDHLPPDPADDKSFRDCVLNFAERESHRPIYLLHQDLLKLRREDPVFCKPRSHAVDGAVIGPEAFLLRFLGEEGSIRLLLVNFGRAARLSPMPEPLLAPLQGQTWQLVWSSEDPRYGGCGVPQADFQAGFALNGQCALVLASHPKKGKEREGFSERFHE